MSAAPGPPAFLLVSPRASRLADVARRDALVAAARDAILARTGTDPEVRVTPSVAAGRAAARAAVAAEAPLVVVVGGDGSVRTAATALGGTGIPLGIVPAGTGNLLAAALRIPRDPSRAIAALARAVERPIDLGEAHLGTEHLGTEHLRSTRPVGDPREIGTDAPGAGVPGMPFLVAAGVGFDARVMAATGEGSKRTLGIAAYFANAAAVALRLRPFEVRLVVDGMTYETDALAVLVANAGDLVPGLVRPRLPLVPDDGRLDILVARGRTIAGGSRAALELLLGRDIHASIGPYATRLAGRSVEVTAATPEPIEVDGDVVGSGHLVARVHPGALRVLVPA